MHGGAVRLELSGSDSEIAILERASQNKDRKLEIARHAASLISPGDYVFLDAGSTTGYMIVYLKEKRAIYVTNSVSHAADLVKKGFKVLLIGGEMRDNTDVIVGADAILHIQKYNFSKGFFGTNGIDVKLGFTTNDVREALIKRVAIEKTAAEGRFILADRTKFGKTSAVTFAELRDVTVLTDGYPGEKYSEISDLVVV